MAAAGAARQDDLKQAEVGGSTVAAPAKDIGSASSMPIAAAVSSRTVSGCSAMEQLSIPTAESLIGNGYSWTYYGGVCTSRCVQRGDGGIFSSSGTATTVATAAAQDGSATAERGQWRGQRRTGGTWQAQRAVHR